MKETFEGEKELKTLSKKQKESPFTFYNLEKTYHIGTKMMSYMQEGLYEKVFVLTYYNAMNMEEALQLICQKPFNHTEKMGYVMVMRRYLDLTTEQALDLMSKTDIDMLSFFVDNMDEVIDALKYLRTEKMRGQIHLVEDSDDENEG